MSELVRADSIEQGNWFIKRTGEFAHLRISESAVKHFGLDPNLVYGVTYTGNMSALKPETLVRPATYEHYLHNLIAETAWEESVGCKTFSNTGRENVGGTKPEPVKLVHRVEKGLPVKWLLPTQADLRLSYEEMRDMWRFACRSFFTEEALRKHNPERTSLIALVRTEDGKIWIRDGLHRVVAIRCANRKLRRDEFTFTEMEYVKFQELNLAAGWFTPFDPRIEVRKADFHAFKWSVRQMLDQRIDPTDFILSHRDMYCEPRRDYHTRLDSYANMVWNEWGLQEEPDPSAETV